MSKVKLEVTAMSPTQYCDKWIPILRPDVVSNPVGYRDACIWLISRAIRYQYGTVKNWGTNFNNVPPRSRTAIEHALGMADALNEIKLKADPYYPSDPH